MFGEGPGRVRLPSVRLPRLPQSHFIDLLERPAFRPLSRRSSSTSCTACGSHGNSAAHGERCRPATAVWLLEEAFDLGRWLATIRTAVRVPPVVPRACSAGRRPPPADQLTVERLAVQERLEGRRSGGRRGCLRIWKRPAPQARVAEANAADLQAALDAGEQAADAFTWTNRPPAAG